MAHIQTTHTGSLPRPPELAELIVKFDHAEATDPAQLQQVVEQATRDVVKQQVDTGIDIVSDGEYSKVSYVTYVKERLTGFDGPPRSPLPRGRDQQEFPDWEGARRPRSSSRPTTQPWICVTRRRSAATWRPSKPPLLGQLRKACS